MRRFVCGLFAIIGLLCVVFPGQITAGLPYVLGGAMVAAGAVYGVVYFRDRNAWANRSSELANGLILLVVGVLCIFHGEDSIVPLGTTWAIIGLHKASKSLSRIIQNYGNGIAFYISLAEVLVRLTFSTMLLFYPIEKLGTHIMLLGMEMIAASIRLTKHMSPALDTDE